MSIEAAVGAAIRTISAARFAGRLLNRDAEVLNDAYEMVRPVRTQLRQEQAQERAQELSSALTRQPGISEDPDEDDSEGPFGLIADAIAWVKENW